MSTLVDTSVVVDVLRQRSVAVEFLTSLPAKPALSVVSVTELYSGVREGRERRALDRYVREFRIIEVSLEIAVEAGLIRRRWGPSHGTGAADAMIAATAILHGLRVATLNRRHFPMLPDLVVPY